jgi:outer membrane protein assembly factor BamE (lipoprotein component of BamABCDE complex)
MRAVIFSLCVFLLAGCGSATSGVMITQDQFDQIQENKASKDEIRQALGSPTTTSLSDSGSQDHFIYTSTVNRPNFIMYIPIFNLFSSYKADMKRVTTAILYNNSNIVIKKDRSEVNDVITVDAFGNMTMKEGK